MESSPELMSFHGAFVTSGVPVGVGVGAGVQTPVGVGVQVDVQTGVGVQTGTSMPSRRKTLS